MPCLPDKRTWHFTTMDNQRGNWLTKMKVQPKMKNAGNEIECDLKRTGQQRQDKPRPALSCGTNNIEKFD